MSCGHPRGPGQGGPACHPVASNGTVSMTRPATT